MITVETAFERIVGAAVPLSTEKLPVAQASGRVIAGPIAARRSQPGSDLSAMDGYAVRSADLTGSDVTLQLVGESAAGHPFSGTVGPGEAVRIFTGAVVPKGADQVVIQENVTASGTSVKLAEAGNPGANIRPLGTDFMEKQTVFDAGTFMTAKSIALAAAVGQSHLMVHRAPKVAIVSTGDELAAPDKNKFSPYETVDSAKPQIEALLREAGAEVFVTKHARDTSESLEAAFEKARGADVLVTIGGASVGEKDLVQGALKQSGMKLDFWKVAMRPGKPLIFGHLENQYVLGLPGNPASAFVCALLFLRPLVDKLMGRPAPLPQGIPLPSATGLPANGPRQHYMRARLIGEPGERHVDAAANQDSSLTSVMAQCDGLIIRPIDGPALKAGDPVPFLPF